jgi:hypothetical protein
MVPVDYEGGDMSLRSISKTSLPAVRPMLRRLVLAVSLLAAMAAGSVFAQQTEVITLKHRPASEVVAAVKPLVEPAGSVTVMQNQLVVRTTAANLAQVKKVVAALDHETRRLLVSVREDSGAGAVAQGQAYSTRTADGNRAMQQVQVVEGGQAFIQKGLSIAVANPAVAVTATGVVATDNTKFRDLNTGFLVSPHLAGDRVTVDISARRDTQANVGTGPGSAESHAVVTTVSGKLGEWISVGGTGQPISGEATDGPRTWSTSSGERRLLLKVEELH